MKVLIIAGQPPSPFSGGEIRLLNLLKHLKGGHDFTVIAPIHDPDDPAVAYASLHCRFVPVLLPARPRRSRSYWWLNAWRQAFLSSKPQMVATVYSPLWARAVENLLRRDTFDVVQVQQLPAVQYLPAGLGCPTVLDVDNLLSRLSARMTGIASERRLARRFQARLDRYKTQRYEERALRRFDACLAISPEDECIIQSLAPRALTAIVPNGVDVAHYVPEGDTSDIASNLLFTGTMNWPPNADAAQFFVHEILPIIREHDPSVAFRIVGRNPSAGVSGLAADPGIAVTGFVQDVRPYLAASTVYVVPLRVGAGTRLKILEALAMGKAVVSTTIGAEGLEVTDGQDILIADEPGEFASKVITLLDDPGLRGELGRNGRRLVESRYDWSVIASRLSEVYGTIRSRRLSSAK